MSITVTVITTANRIRRFTLNDQNSIDTLLDKLKRSAQLFSGKPLIIRIGTTDRDFLHLRWPVSSSKQRRTSAPTSPLHMT